MWVLSFLSINRNILECKLHGNWQKSSGFFSINRNILECKFRKVISFPTAASVLIETYWNVNKIGALVIFRQSHVLIETYWNVKLEDYREIRAMQCGINRNILECKGRIRMV